MAEVASRTDWSWLNGKLKKLQPGESLSVECPAGIEMRTMRSLILTNGRRFHRGEWRVCTRTVGRVVMVYLGVEGGG